MARFIFIIGMAFVVLSAPDRVQAQMLETNTERAGATYMRGVVNSGGPEVCWSLCAKDAKCKAWTWERPGVSGPRSMCSLKAAVTPGRFSPCCVSGVSAHLEQQIELGLNGQPARQQTAVARTSFPVPVTQVVHQQNPGRIVQATRTTTPSLPTPVIEVRSVPVVPVNSQPRRSGNGVPIYSINRDIQPAPTSVAISYPQADGLSTENAQKLKASLQLLGQ